MTSQAAAAQMLPTVAARVLHVSTELGDSLAALAQVRDEIVTILGVPADFAANVVRAAIGDRRPELAAFFASAAA